MQLLTDLDKVNNEKKIVEEELTELRAKEISKDNTQQETNSRLL